MSVHTSQDGPVFIVEIDRPASRNAVDRATAAALADAFREFDATTDLYVAVLSGRGGHFCAGADLKAIANGTPNRFDADGDGPMGPTRMQLSKPVIAAIEGYAVAGGLELTLWCDLRIASATARFGVLCRRFGVPLIDRGAITLPRVIGQGRALDMILTGREVTAHEALSMGLVSRVVDQGESLQAAIELAHDLSRLPQLCMRNDRQLTLEQWSLTDEQAQELEYQLGRETLESGETGSGARRFRSGAGRGGSSCHYPSGKSPKKNSTPPD